MGGSSIIGRRPCQFPCTCPAMGLSYVSALIGVGVCEWICGGNQASKRQNKFERAAPLTSLELSANEISLCKDEMPNDPTFTLSVKNTSAENVAFQLKTAKPKNFLVRPSGATLKSSETQEVEFTLCSADAAENVRHLANGFLLRATTVQTDARLSNNDWAELANSDQSRIQERRLNVTNAPVKVLTVVGTLEDTLIVKAMLLSGVEIATLTTDPAA